MTMDPMSSEALVEAAALPTRTVRLGRGMSLTCGVDFLVDGGRRHHDHVLQVGSLEVWDVVNETAEDQAFLLHGFSFRVLDVNGLPPAVRAWVDTVSVPPKGRVRIAWRVDDRPGRWMCRFHPPGQNAAGMMLHFRVVTDASAATCVGRRFGST